MQPKRLIVSSKIYKIVERLLNTKKLNIECGNYCKYQYKDEKPYWQKKEYILNEGESPKLEEMIRNYDCWNGYCEEIETVSLPKAMRKQGYVIKCKYVGYGNYNKWIEKAKVHNKFVIEEKENHAVQIQRRKFENLYD